MHAPRDELEDEDAQGPVVAAARGATMLNDLGRQVVGRAAHGVCPPALKHELGKAQVRELQVAAAVHQNVLRLQVTEHERGCKSETALKAPANETHRYT